MSRVWVCKDERTDGRAVINDALKMPEIYQALAKDLSNGCFRCITVPTARRTDILADCTQIIEYCNFFN